MIPDTVRRMEERSYSVRENRLFCPEYESPKPLIIFKALAILVCVEQNTCTYLVP